MYGSLTAFPAAIVKELLSAVNEDDSIPLESLPLDELLSELNEVVRNVDEWPAETRHWALRIIQMLIVDCESKWVMHYWGALASTVLTGLTDPNPESSDDPKMRENDTRLVTHRLSAPPALRRSYESVRPEAISTGIELPAFNHSSDERIDGSPIVLDVQTAIEDRIDDPTIEEATAFGSVFFSTDQALGEEILENIFDPDAALTSVFRAGWFSCLREIHKLAVERQEPYVIPPGEFPDRITMSIKVVSDRDDPHDIELQILAQTLVNAFIYDLSDAETWLRRFLNETPPGTSDAVASRVVPTENFIPDMWSDVKALWELRLEMVSDPSAHAREFALYCRWLHHDDLSLTLSGVEDLLSETVQYVGGSSRAWQRIVDFLASACQYYPDTAVEITESLVTTHDVLSLSKWDDSLETICQTAFDHSGETAVQAIVVVETFVQAGDERAERFLTKNT